MEREMTSGSGFPNGTFCCKLSAVCTSASLTLPYVIKKYPSRIPAGLATSAASIGADVLAPHPHFAQLADLFDERGAVGIRMLGLEPNEREIRGLHQSRFRAVRVWVARERVGTLGAGEIVIAERDI